ncbi:MAG: hypothetical protein CVV33_02170 [Methanomicrobiales archaeon HGW-Methanomicrobiales-4]|nr:MAG: hypothetical protein CVV33_02170 [Methanomicrobiales archaeon HGW-Methanomicrobiales-4]
MVDPGTTRCSISDGGDFISLMGVIPTYFLITIANIFIRLFLISVGTEGMRGLDVPRMARRLIFQVHRGG